jgi:hypothetical protein
LKSTHVEIRKVDVVILLLIVRWAVEITVVKKEIEPCVSGVSVLVNIMNGGE